MMNGFWAVARKELIHLARDRATIAMAILMPLFQLVLYGYAVDFDVRHIPSVLVDYDRTASSQAYARSLESTQYLDFRFRASSPEEAARRLRAGDAQVAVVVPPDFTRKLASGDEPTVGVMLDGSDSQVSTRARLAFMRPTSQNGVSARVQVLFNPTGRTAVYMIPGLMVILIQLVLTSLTSASLVREREQGSLEQLMVSPVGKYALMLGKLAPFFGLALLELLGVTFFAMAMFGVRVAGSYWLLVGMSLPFIFACLALGLLISVVAQNQAQSLQLSTLTTMPSILLSGYIFPRETMPGFLVLLSGAFPVTHQIRIARGIMVRGAGFMDLWPALAATTLIGFVIVMVAATKFQKSVA